MPTPTEHKMTAEEYFKTPETNKHVELRDGVLIEFEAPSEVHQDMILGIASEIRRFIKANNGSCKPMISPFDVKLDDYNVVQPDVMVICDSDKMDGKRCYGAPDWCIEVLSTNRRDDLVEKLALYSKFGVREYWIVDPKNSKVLVYFFEKSDFPNIYTFDTAIPVGIYDGKLNICINDLI
ncbi:MAG TPA: Uma2 family endonuclease [Ruminococcus flavefaciens]|nr:Uma2 family endonuclease [Ruminococcus flavefaciens]